MTAASVLASTALPALVAPAHAATRTRYVATTGSDSNDGTLTAPYRTVRKGLTSLLAGDTLVVRGGTYAERIMNPSLVAGTAAAHTKVVAYAGERPVVQGLLWLNKASYWDINGLNVTWDARNLSSEHMVKLTGGTGWSFTGAEVWGARSYAGILVAGTPTGWRVAGNYVHDTYKTNGTNQDHLIYANSGSGAGVIERNILVRSSNGRAIKVGPPSATSGTVANIVIRYNTMAYNTGPSNVQLAWGTSGVQIYRNIMTNPGVNRSNVTAYQLTGTGNVVRQNLGWAAPRVLDTASAGLKDGGGNVMTDPRFVNAAGSDFHTLTGTAALFGRYAL